MLGAMSGVVPDANGAPLGDASRMSSRTQLIVELDASSDPVQGTIGPSAGDPTPFSGYVQLIAALEVYRQREGFGTVANRGPRGYRGERDRIA